MLKDMQTDEGTVTSFASLMESHLKELDCIFYSKFELVSNDLYLSGM